MGPLKPNQPVILTSIPPGLLTGLPRSDQNALRAVVGRAVTFVDYSGPDQAEIAFVDSEGDGHTFYVDPTCLTTREDYIQQVFDRIDKRVACILEAIDKIIEIIERKPRKEDSMKEDAT